MKENIQPQKLMPSKAGQKRKFKELTEVKNEIKPMKRKKLSNKRQHYNHQRIFIKYTCLNDF